MRSRLLAIVIAQAFMAAAAQAQATAPAPAQPAQVEGSAPGSRTPDAREEVIHVEDQGASIDEVRVRGETKSINVTPKAAVPPYEIVVPAGDGRTSSGVNGSDPRAGAAGQRVWRVLDF